MSVKLESVEFLIQHIKRIDPRLYEALIRFSRFMRRFSIRLDHLDTEVVEDLTEGEAEVISIPNVQNLRADPPTTIQLRTTRGSSVRIGRTAGRGR